MATGRPTQGRSRSIWTRSPARPRPRRTRSCTRSSSGSTWIRPAPAPRSTAARSSDQAAIAVLGAFADLCSLSPERQDLGQDVERGTVTSSREYFNTFLRSLDAEREGLPAWFVDRLSRAVARYGIDGLDPSDELAASLLRIFVAQQRRDDQIPVVMEVLDRQESPIPGLRETLDRLIEATRRRHPSIASMSRTVRYSLFDRPVIDGVRSDVSATMRQLAAELAHPSGPSGSDASDTSDRLVACPLPLGPIFAEGGLFAEHRACRGHCSRCSPGGTTGSGRSAR